jgi:hypothetical protein
MPIYEYYSPDTHKIYKFYATSISQKDVIPKCPDGEQHRMERSMSAFAITGKTRKSKKEGEKPLSMNDDDIDLGDPRVQSLMKEMERAVEGMDPDHPDPRIMGSLLRKMGDTMGEKFDDQMEEVVRRLEEGADPDSLEGDLDGVLGDGDSYGDPYGDPYSDPFGGSGPEDPNAPKGEKEPKGFDIRGESKRLLRLLRPPVRDPQLYTYE